MEVLPVIVKEQPQTIIVPLNEWKKLQNEKRKRIEILSKLLVIIKDTERKIKDIRTDINKTLEDIDNNISQKSIEEKQSKNIVIIKQSKEITIRQETEIQHIIL